MGSQFVDFNFDGQLDIVAATYDGSPYNAYGSAKGFEKPEQFKDSKGNRIMFVCYYDYDVEPMEAWKNTGEDHCISALAFDWDHDGDYDLLLGSKGGKIYRQMNEGTKKAHKFTGVNIPVKAGDEPLMNPGELTDPEKARVKELEAQSGEAMKALNALMENGIKGLTDK